MTKARKNLRPRLVPLIVLATALGASAIYRAELRAWFGGSPLASGQSEGTTAKLGAATLTANLNPDPPRQEGNTVELRLVGGDATPISDANIAVTYFMPAMGAMPEMRGSADIKSKGDGRYTASFDLPSPGTWELSVSADQGDGRAETRFSITVGSKGLTAKDNGAGGAASDDEVAYYTCSMHPSVRADEPGQCPICSMDLTPVTKGEQESGVLRIDGQRSQRIGVRYTTVERKSLSRSILAVGEVNADENRLADVAMRTAGWIDKLHVEETGEYVTRGQSLLELYSPDVLAASEEVLAARRSTGTTRDRLVAAADRKLLLLGVTAGQLKRLVVRGKARDRISVSSPTNGYVVEKNVVEGDHVEQGASLLRIADLSKVWVDAQVYEADLALVKLGQPVSVTLPFVPGQRFAGSIGYIHPRLDPQTRTVRVRVVLENPDLVLRPGMYADVAIDVDMGERVVVPQEAVVYSGTRRLVFVDLGEGRLQPREVLVGVRAGGLIEVLEGVSEGESVVSSGNFLIAAESRIRSATTIWAVEPSDAKGEPAVAPDADHNHAHYTCPMHPEVHEHESGQCPVCGMDLEAAGGTGFESGTTRSEDAPQPAGADEENQKSRKTKKKPANGAATGPKPIASDGGARPTQSKKTAQVSYTCPMHPRIVEDAAGQCPICGMKLVEKKAKGTKR